MQSQKNNQIPEATDSAISATAAQKIINIADYIKNHDKFRIAINQIPKTFNHFISVFQPRFFPF